MNHLLSQEIVLPDPPAVPAKLGMSDPFRAYLRSVITYLVEANRTLRADISSMHQLLNTMVQGVGDDLASDTTISPSSPIHVVTGTAAISTISVPTGFSGPWWALPSGAWTMVTGGNIALGTTAVVNRALCMIFNPRTNLWYPSY